MFSEAQLGEPLRVGYLFLQPDVVNGGPEIANSEGITLSSLYWVHNTPVTYWYT